MKDCVLHIAINHLSIYAFLETSIKLGHLHGYVFSSRKENKPCNTLVGVVLQLLHAKVSSSRCRTAFWKNKAIASASGGIDNYFLAQWKQRWYAAALRFCKANQMHLHYVVRPSHHSRFHPRSLWKLFLSWVVSFNSRHKVKWLYVRMGAGLFEIRYSKSALSQGQALHQWC